MVKLWNHRKLNAGLFMIISALLLISNLSIAEVRLPPEPPKVAAAKTLIGFDANKNQVDDGLERYMYQELAIKAPDKFKAYLLLNETLLKIMVNADKPEVLKKLFDIYQDDSACIAAFGASDVIHLSHQSRAWLLKDPARSEAFTKAFRHFGPDLKSPPTDKRSKCRF